jgi:hypothetical protein
MRKGKGLARRYLILAAAAAAVAVSAAAAQAVPARAQAVSASRTATGAFGLVATHAGSDSDTLFAICLTHSPTNCLAWGPSNSIVLDSSINPIIEWREVSNGLDTTFESEGVSAGSDGANDLCLAAAANKTGGNNRVYATSNCWNNSFAQWFFPSGLNQPGFFENQYSLSQGQVFTLTALNTREGAFLYVVQAGRTDTWQNFNTFNWG